MEFCYYQSDLPIRTYSVRLIRSDGSRVRMKFACGFRGVRNDSASSAIRHQGSVIVIPDRGLMESTPACEILVILGQYGGDDGATRANNRGDDVLLRKLLFVSGKEMFDFKRFPLLLFKKLLLNTNAHIKIWTCSARAYVDPSRY